MDPVTTTIIAALVAGATAAAKDVATSAIKDAYQGLKRLITDRYKAARPALDVVDVKPDSSEDQEVLAKELDRAGIANDQQAKDAARALLDALEELRGVEAAAPLFDFDRLHAARNFEMSDIDAVGTVLKARDAEFSGDVKITGIRQSGRGGTGEKK